MIKTEYKNYPFKNDTIDKSIAIRRSFVARVKEELKSYTHIKNKVYFNFTTKERAFIEKLFENLLTDSYLMNLSREKKVKYIIGHVKTSLKLELYYFSAYSYAFAHITFKYEQPNKSVRYAYLQIEHSKN